MKDFALKGLVVYTPAPDKLIVRENAYAVCENGVCAGVFDELPEKYAGLHVEDHGRRIITPGFTDMHLHAPQYENLGLGMDLELLDWLEKLTFPEEAKYADAEYARGAYSHFVSDMRRGSTVRAVIFATVHTEATVLLMELMEKSGLKSFVGRVNMDRNTPDILCEKSAAASLDGTEEWLSAIKGRFSRTAPIITPRFVPSCTPELMEGLGTLADMYSLPVQSHLSETRAEIKWVRSLHPDCSCYGEVYEKYGLMGNRTVMAHCVYPTEADIEILLKTGAYIAHCPTSNTNIKSGISPVRKLLERRVNIGLGSDISGGNTTDMSAVIREAIAVSKHASHLSNYKTPALHASEAFYLATKGGGSFFGKCGSFEEGYEFDAVVFDDKYDAVRGGVSPEKRFERLIYTGTRSDAKAKYVSGRKIY